MITKTGDERICMARSLSDLVTTSPAPIGPANPTFTKSANRHELVLEHLTTGEWMTMAQLMELSGEPNRRVVTKALSDVISKGYILGNKLIKVQLKNCNFERSVNAYKVIVE